MHLFVNDNLASARQRIDEEIASLSTQIIILKTKRNTLTPVARLHPEIIQEVFLLASRGSNPGQCGKMALEISWVCRNWRALALETSALWSYIDFFDLGWAETALFRSRNRELSFVFTPPFEDYEEEDPLALLCLENLSRIRTLSVNRFNFPYESPSWVNPAPVLVELELHHVHLPPGLFSKTFPSLKVLILVECHLEWDSLPVHAGIEILRLREPQIQGSVEDVVQIIQIIAPNVHELSLRTTLFQPTVTSPDRITEFLHPRQTFPRIRLFELEDEPAEALRHIFDRFTLDLPSQTNVTVSMKGGIEQIATINSFVSFRGQTQWPVIGLDILIWNTGFDIRLRERPSTVNGCDYAESNVLAEARNNENGEDSDNQISLTIDRSQALGDIVTTLNLLPLPPIRALEISGGYFENQGPHVLDYFSAQGKVELLDIAIPYVQTFTRFIDQQNQQIRLIVGDTDHEDLDDGIKGQIRNLVAFHQLHTLRYFSDTHLYCLMRQFYTILSEWLRWRKVVGLGLEALIFLDMSIPPQDCLTGLFKDIVDVDLYRVKETNAGNVKFRP